MQLFHTFGVLVIFEIIGCVHGAGWALDKSCKVYANQIRASMPIAFARAEAVQAQLARATLDPDVLATYELLFDNDGAFNDPSGRSTNSKVKTIFNNIVDMRNEIPINLLDDTTAVVFCDFSRFQPNPTDNSMLQVVGTGEAIPNDAEFQARRMRCDNPDPATFPKTEAFTTSWFKGGLASQIQICDWFLALSFDTQFTQSKNWKMKQDWEKFIQKVMFWKKKEIDVFADFAGTLLHELTHTRHASFTAIGGKIMEDELGYGWEKSRSDISKALNNADNFHYFAIAIWQMTGQGQNGKGYNVRADGKLVARSNILTKRHGTSLKWFA